MAEWTWSETSRADGRRHTVEDAIIFALRDDQIVYWREYFDTAGSNDLSPVQKWLYQPLD